MFEEVYCSNKSYWKRENDRVESDGILIYDNFYHEPQLQYGISKVALCISKSLNLKPAVLLRWKDSPMSKSMCDMQFQMRDKVYGIVFRHFFRFLGVLLFINKKKLLNYSIGQDKLGISIYDGILRRFSLKTLNGIGLKYRLNIIFELCYYFYFHHILTNYPVKAVVIGDNVYRFGLLFEMCKNRGILCFSPVNLNSFFIRKFEDKDDFKSNYLTNKLLDKLCGGVDFKNKVDRYFSDRYHGNIEQHDVLSAYSNKTVSTKQEFIDKYKIETSKKTVILMCHVFADAPHAYSDALYNDYWEWFTASYACLKSNPGINLLVKEHPSSHLYGQKGLIEEFLKGRGEEYRQIREDESTLSILQNVDAVVTCGGTIGLEISYFKKNVVLASKPPYSGLGFSKDFDNKEEYENYLKKGIQDVKNLTEEQHTEALRAAYVIFCLENNWTPTLELGGEIVYMGKEYDDKALCNNIMRYNKIGLNEQNVYRSLDGFVHSDFKQFYNIIKKD